MTDAPAPSAEDIAAGRRLSKLQRARNFGMGEKDAAALDRIIAAAQALTAERERVKALQIKSDNNFLKWRLVEDERQIEKARATAAEAQVKEMQEGIKAFLGRDVCLTNKNVPDKTVVPLECSLGELRALAALATTKDAP